MMLRIASWPLEVGRGPRRSTDMTSQGCKGGVCEFRAVDVGNHNVLFSWQAAQPFMYLWTLHDKPGQKKDRSIRF